MKVWITKYALTDGIIEAEAKDCGYGMIETVGKYSNYFHGEGRQWHKEKESAITKAEEMRQKKIASLKKQIERLEKMKFG